VRTQTVARSSGTTAGAASVSAAVDVPVELRELRYFVAVAEELHFGRAAQRLHMSQSPLSRAIRDLERELGVALFIRTTRRVELTPAGSALLERARRALAEIDGAMEEARRAARPDRGVLTVGYGPLSRVTATRVVEALAAARPDLPIRLDEDTTPELLTRVAVPLTFEQFRYGFANAVSEDEAKELYVTYAVPGSGEPIFQAAAANLNPWSEAKVDTKNPDRGPLLIISGEKDHTVPWPIANSSYKHQQGNRAVTEIIEIKGRGHALTIDSGWREVADTAPGFVRRFA
jgi:pimeloyl-ACP methyl ester carboxylesterase